MKGRFISLNSSRIWQMHQYAHHVGMNTPVRNAIVDARQNSPVQRNKKIAVEAIFLFPNGKGYYIVGAEEVLVHSLHDFL
jgi:hypothetical protein